MNLWWINRAYLPACLALGLMACGGGGGSTPAPPPPPVAPPPPPPPVVNQPPRLNAPNEDQFAVAYHLVDYDVTQNGRTFTDPEGGALTYQIKLGHVYNPDNDPDPPQGVRIEGTRLVGTPDVIESIVVTVQASDSAGLTESDQFTIFVSINGTPHATDAHNDVIVPVGGNVSVDARIGSGQFSDPENDPLTYLVTLRGAPGLTVNGTQVSGSLSAVGATEVTITATDPFGASTSDVFLVAAPGPVSGTPTLPATSYTYEGPTPDMPFVYRGTQWFDAERLENKASNPGATLGRVLFYDKRLSITNTMACGSCHHQAHGFADSVRFSVGILGIPLTRQTMPLANVRFNDPHAWFSDMRQLVLQHVARTALQSTQEMGMNPALLEEKLRATSFYPPLFEAAFGTPEITEERALAAIEQFLLSMVSHRSKFDRAYNSMDGTPLDPSLVFDAQELRGLAIFQGDGGVPCQRCHDLQIGVNKWWANNGIDVEPTDPGTQDPLLMRGGARGVFRAAALKNVALSAPYMHDGRFATLREVIDHYDHNIQASSHLDVLLRDPSDQPLRMNLSDADKDALEAFLRTLTDDAMVTDAKFSDPFQ